MRIIILSDRIPPESPGGAGKIAWSLACGLREAGHEVHVIAATRQNSFNEEREGIPTYHLHSHFPNRFRAYFALYNPQIAAHLRRLFENIKPDVVNAHNVHNYLSYYSLTLANRVGIPTVFTSHDVMPFAYSKLTHFIDPARCTVDSPDQYRLPHLYNLRQMRFRYNPLRNYLIRLVLRRHTQVRTCVSHALRQALEANLLPPFRVVHNGLAPDSLDVPNDEIIAMRRRLNLEDRQVILFGGRLAYKGINQLLTALNKVVTRIPKATLLVLARGKIGEPDTIRTRFPNLREHHIRQPGWLTGPDLAAAYHLADTITVPSICLDSFPTVNLVTTQARTI